MIWQDLVITIAMIFLSYALVPQVLSGFKTKKTTIKIQTALITTIGILLMGITYFTLELYFSFGIAITQSFLWALLLIQSIRYKKIIN